MSTERRIPEGPRLYMESCLDAQEYRECYRKYPNTYNMYFPSSLSEFKEGEFKCRYRMGAKLTEEEINLINGRIDTILKEAGLYV